MGYRLEIYKTEYKACGGKLYGYVSDETLDKCKSLQWLVSHGYIYKEDKYLWDYGFDHLTMLYGDSLKEFIKLYLEDYEQYGYNCEDTKEELKELLKCKNNECFIISWE